MRRGLLVASSGLLALVLVTAAQPAGAWKQSKVPRGTSCLAWQPREIHWSPALPLGGELEAADVLNVFRRSFAAWEQASCSDLSFVERPSSPRTVGFSKNAENQNVLLFRDRACEDLVPDDDPCIEQRSCSEAYDCWDFDEKLIAVTTVTFSRCSGEIFDADIEINAAGFHFTTVDGPRCTKDVRENCIAMDLQNTMVHEIGHLIGLDHSPRKDAVMYANAASGETIKRQLSSDDEKALCTIYPVGGETRTCGGVHGSNDCAAGKRQQSSEGLMCGSQAGSSGAASLWAGALALLGLAHLAWRRRRKV